MYTGPPKAAFLAPPVSRLNSLLVSLFAVIAYPSCACNLRRLDFRRLTLCARTLK